MQMDDSNLNTPSSAYVSATWAVLAIGVFGYLLGLWNAELQFNEKGYYFAVFLFAMFSAVTLQKTVRDKKEGIPVTAIFSTICWVSFGAAIGLLVVGLFNASMLLSEKGFFGMAFVLSLFAVVTAQKNIRDVVAVEGNQSNSDFIAPNKARKVDDKPIDL